MRVILYVGKGGVGKTTIAAATATMASVLGHRTLVVSTDTAHSLGDSFDLSLKSTPTQVQENLWAQEINVLDEVRTSWHKLENYFAMMLKKRGAEDVIAEELALLPGMDEIISLLEIWKHIKSGNYDSVVIDAAPTGETVRLLSMPELFMWYADRIGNWHSSAMRVAMPLLRPLMPKANVFEAIPQLADQVQEMQKSLTNPQIASYRVVLNPEKMVVKEGQRAATYLSLFNYPVDAVINNRVMPEASADPFFAALCQRQQEYRDLIYRTFAPLPILEVPMKSKEVVGLDGLTELAHDIFKEKDPTGIYYRGKTQDIIKVDDEYVLQISLPNLEVEKVNMTKKGDELIVEIGNFKRDMILPAALANRNARAAKFKDGILNVHFSN